MRVRAVQWLPLATGRSQSTATVQPPGPKGSLSGEALHLINGRPLGTPASASGPSQTNKWPAEWRALGGHLRPLCLGCVDWPGRKIPKIEFVVCFGRRQTRPPAELSRRAGRPLASATVERRPSLGRLAWGPSGAEWAPEEKEKRPKEQRNGPRRAPFGGPSDKGQVFDDRPAHNWIPARK